MILIQKVINLIPGLLCVHTSLLAAGSSNGVTNTACCRYSCLHSWRRVVVPPETCRAVSR